MFLDDIALVEQLTERYGLMLPFVDLGGQADPIVADYARLPDSPFVRLGARPYDHIAPGYLILNPELGDPPIEDLPQREAFGTVVCSSVLEHVENPFEVFAGFRRVLKPGGLLVVSTVFSYRHHDAPRDFWRFSPECLEMLASVAGLAVLESGWRVNALLVQHDEWNLVRSVYVAATWTN
jgi:SAM-dependent methyltransferase